MDKFFYPSHNQTTNTWVTYSNSHLACRYISSTTGTSTMLSREQRENSFVLQPVHCISRISNGVQCPVKYSASFIILHSLRFTFSLCPAHCAVQVARASSQASTCTTTMLPTTPSRAVAAAHPGRGSRSPVLSLCI